MWQCSEVPTSRMRLLLVSSRVLVVLEPEGRLKVWRTSGLNTEQATQLMDLNPVNVALTGGGACRRCVEECPDG